MWNLMLALVILFPPHLENPPPRSLDAGCVASSPQQAERSDQPPDLQIPFVDIDIYSFSSTRQGNETIFEDYVDLRTGTMRLQCDKLILNEETYWAEAIGNVVYDQEGQRIAGSRARFNLKTRKGTIWDATGFTDRTPDGVTLYFEAARIDRVGLDRFEIQDGRVTSCQEAVPKWTFGASRIGVKLNQRVSVRSPTLRMKNIPVFWLPYATVPITKRVRSSGFLMPGLGSSNVRGRSIRIPYYQTLGRSADVTPRFELYTRRGIGVGADFRSRSGQRSYLNTGFLAVFDRLFGEEGPDQGGTAFYLDAVQYFPKGFLFAADVNITSNLDFRQIFSDDFDQAISPEERTQIYLNNNFGDFSFNLLLQSRDVFLPDEQVKIRQLPSFELSGRPRQLSKRWPVYFSFRAAAEGLSRSESTFKTPSVVQRLDLRPDLTVTLPSVGGLAITPSLTLRSTFYSNSADPNDRTAILGDDFHRAYLEFNLDIRPPALERVFHHRDGSRWFKHVIEPSITYRRIFGIGSDFARIIRFDQHDTITDTNHFELALINRFFVTRPSPSGQGQQPHEWLTVKLAQQYYFDSTFGDALIPGRRNQFDPITRLSAFSFGGTERRFSPLNLSVRLRPLSSIFANVRFDYDTRQETIRNVSLTGGFRRKKFAFSQTWHLTRPIRLENDSFEPGTFPGNLYQSSLFLGNIERGFFAGFDILYDFTDRIIDGSPTSGRMVSSNIRFGYTFDCCSLQIQNTTFKIGLRNENRLAFSLTLFGIGSFGRHTTAGRRIFGP